MRILCFGDSNTYGYDPRGYFADRYAAGNRWTDLLANQTGWEIINAGVNGRMIPRNPYILRILKEYSPVDMLIVMLGTNDLLQGASAIDASARMEHFLNQILPQYNYLLLVTPPPMKRGAWVPTDELVMESIRLAKAYCQLAQRLDIPFADTSDWDIEMAFDGVHITEEGHHTFADKLARYINSLLCSDGLTGNY